MLLMNFLNFFHENHIAFSHKKKTIFKYLYVFKLNFLNPLF
jgi:hypothetical protein